jgi:hypothetical protein
MKPAWHVSRLVTVCHTVEIMIRPKSSVVNYYVSSVIRTLDILRNGFYKECDITTGPSWKFIFSPSIMNKDIAWCNRVNYTDEKRGNFL